MNPREQAAADGLLFPQRDVLHVRVYTGADSLVGLSPIVAAGYSLAYTNSIQQGLKIQRDQLSNNEKRAMYKDLDEMTVQGRVEVTTSELVAALWDLVWAGEVSNDTFAPFRSLIAGSSRARRRERAFGHRARRRILPGSEGRWTLLPRDAEEASATECATARAACSPSRSTGNVHGFHRLPSTTSRRISLATWIT